MGELVAKATAIDVPSAAWTCAPALAAANGVGLKPAGQSPLSVPLLAEFASGVGLPVANAQTDGPTWPPNETQSIRTHLPNASCD